MDPEKREIMPRTKDTRNLFGLNAADPLSVRRRIRVHPAGRSSVILAIPSHGLIVSGCTHGTISVIHLEDNRVVRLQDPAGARTITCLAQASCTSPLIASGHIDGMVRTWDITADGHLKHIIQVCGGEESRVESILLLNERLLIAKGHGIHLALVATGAITATFAEHEAPVGHLLLVGLPTNRQLAGEGQLESADIGQTVISGAHNGHLIVWHIDEQNGTAIHIKPAHSNKVTALVQCSTNHDLVASAGLDHIVCIWACPTATEWQCLHTLNASIPNQPQEIPVSLLFHAGSTSSILVSQCGGQLHMWSMADTTQTPRAVVLEVPSYFCGLPGGITSTGDAIMALSWSGVLFVWAVDCEEEGVACSRLAAEVPLWHEGAVFERSGSNMASMPKLTSDGRHVVAIAPAYDVYSVDLDMCGSLNAVGTSDDASVPLSSWMPGGHVLAQLTRYLGYA